MEKEGKVGDPGGRFPAEQQVFDIAALEGEVGCGGLPCKGVEAEQ